MNASLRKGNRPWTPATLVTIASILFVLESPAFSTPPASTVNANAASPPRSYVLAPVGPEIIFDQTDQDCGGTIFTDTYTGCVGFLRNLEPPGAIGADYWNADGTEPTPDFIATGNQHLYWLDQIFADGRLINGIDLKYWTTTTGPNVIKFHFRSETVLPDVGNHHGMEYVMTVPGASHPLRDPTRGGGYFIRMSTPSLYDIANGAMPGYRVEDLADPDNGFEVEMPAWTPVGSLDTQAFGAAMSLNEGWDGHTDPGDATMGWFLAGVDLQNPVPILERYTWLDKDADRWTDPITGGAIGDYWYGPPNCDPESPPGAKTPVASVYLKLWAKDEDCNHNGLPDDQDIAWGTSEDCNGNGVPDECEPGDVDGDGDVDLTDFATFALCFTGANVTVPPPSCSEASFCSSDIDGDNDVDLADFATFALNFTG